MCVLMQLDMWVVLMWIVCEVMASNEGETASPTAVAAQESKSSVLRTSCILDSILECL